MRLASLIALAALADTGEAAAFLAALAHAARARRRRPLGSRTPPGGACAGREAADAARNRRARAQVGGRHRRLRLAAVGLAAAAAPRSRSSSTRHWCSSLPWEVILAGIVLSFDVDVAVLRVDDDEFWRGAAPLPLPHTLPSVMSEVLASRTRVPSVRRVV